MTPSCWLLSSVEGRQSSLIHSCDLWGSWVRKVVRKSHHLRWFIWPRVSARLTFSHQPIPLLRAWWKKTTKVKIIAFFYKPAFLSHQLCLLYFNVAATERKFFRPIILRSQLKTLPQLIKNTLYGYQILTVPLNVRYCGFKHLGKN